MAQENQVNFLEFLKSKKGSKRNPQNYTAQFPKLRKTQRIRFLSSVSNHNKFFA